MTGLLNFSEAAALALHAMACVAREKGEVVSAAGVAERLGASEAHTIKVCQRLAREQLLLPHRGASGGFTLGKSPARIRLLDIYSAIEGPVRVKACLFPHRECGGGKGKCPFGEFISGFEREMLDYLRTTSLAALVAHCEGDEAAAKRARGTKVTRGAEVSREAQVTRGTRASRGARA